MNFLRHFPTITAMARWLRRVTLGEGIPAVLSLLANPCFRWLMNLDRSPARRPWRHAMVGMAVTGLLLAAGMTGLAIKSSKTVNLWSGARIDVVYDITQAIPLFVAVAILIVFFVVVPVFIRVARLIANGTMEHVVITPLGWRGVLAAQAGGATIRAAAMVLPLIVVTALLPQYLNFTNDAYVYAVCAALACVPAVSFGLIQMALYWAIRHYHVRSFALGGLLAACIGIGGFAVFVGALVIIMLMDGISTWHLSQYKPTARIWHSIIVSIPVVIWPMFIGLGLIYWGRLMELTRGPAMEHLATGRHQRVRPFGSAPWWRVDLLRRLWPLKTWARMRFLTNVYLLIMLVLLIPVSMAKSLGMMGVGAVALVAGLPFYLCLATLPRHWAEAQSALPRTWTGDGLPDHAHDIPPIVMFQILMGPWQALFAVSGLVVFGMAWAVLAMTTTYPFYLIGGRINMVSYWLLSSTMFSLMIPGLALAGSLFALLYLRHVIECERFAGDVNPWRTLIRPVAGFIAGVIALAIFVQFRSLAYLWEQIRYGVMTSVSGVRLFMILETTLSVAMIAVVWVFFPAYARLSRQVLRMLHDMKGE